MEEIPEILQRAQRDIESGNPDAALSELNKLPSELKYCWEICYLRAKCALQSGHLEDAIAELRLAVLDESSEPQAYLLLVECILKTSKHTEAGAILGKLIKHQPMSTLLPFAENIGTFFLNAGFCDEAIEWANVSIDDDPSKWQFHNLLGVAYHRRGSILDGLQAFKDALSLNPDSPIIHHNLAGLLQQYGSFKLALHHMERAFLIDPTSTNVALLYYYSIKLLDFERSKKYGDLLKSQLTSIKPDFIEPFPWLMLTDDGAIIQDVNKRNAAKFRIVPKERIHRPIGKKIRLGYLSNDFTHHATGFLIRAMLQHHDREQFEIIGFDFTEKKDPTSYRSEILDHLTEIHELHEKSDAEAATLVQECGIDILVDLKGYTKGSRPEIMLKKPAPIQVNFLGYPATMGSSAIDYIIGDPVVTPFEHAPWYTEHIVQLPCCYQPNDPNRRMSSQTSRSDHQLNNDWFVFANFNYCTKFTEPLNTSLERNSSRMS